MAGQNGSSAYHYQCWQAVESKNEVITKIPIMLLKGHRKTLLRELVMDKGSNLEKNIKTENIASGRLS
ncbi:hypothetical protein CIL06_21635 [Pantoea vagans]|nr:hypothetical protein CIL06_21635 [Pantoea vagans]